MGAAGSVRGWMCGSWPVAELLPLLVPRVCWGSTRAQRSCPPRMGMLCNVTRLWGTSSGNRVEGDRGGP